MAFLQIRFVELQRFLRVAYLANDTAIRTLTHLGNSLDAALVTNSELSHSTLISSVTTATIVLCVGLIGLFGNTMNIAVFARKSNSSISVLIVGLSVMDACLILLAFCAYMSQGYSVVLDSRQLDRFIVYIPVAFYPLCMIAQTMTIWILVVITIDRYLAVAYPLNARIFFTVSKAKVSLVVVLIASIIYNFPRFWEYRVAWGTTASAQSNSTTTSVKLTEWLRRDPNYFLAYITVLYLISHFLVPFLILASVNCLIVRIVRNAQKERERLTARANTEHTTAIMMVVVVFVFVLCNTTPFVLNICEVMDPNLFGNRMTLETAYLLTDINNTLVTINSSVNFLIYYAFSHRYRKRFNEILCSTNATSSQRCLCRMFRTPSASFRSSAVEPYIPMTIGNVDVAQPAGSPTSIYRPHQPPPSLTTCSKSQIAGRFWSNRRALYSRKQISQNRHSCLC